MREAFPQQPPVALTIAGSDSGGGAGIQADIKTMEAMGVFATTVVTAVTAQNTQGVQRSHVLPEAEIAGQIEAVREDFDVRALKTGMLATGPVIDLVAERVSGLDASLVVDPVMVAESGDRLLDAEAEDAYESLIAEATVVTPNAEEASVLTDVEVTGAGSAGRAASELTQLGADAAVVTGGHLEGDTVQDVLVTGDSQETIEHTRIDTGATHGSGCTLSCAITARLAQHTDCERAVRESISTLQRAVRYPQDVGEGPGPVNHLADIKNEAAREPTAEAVEGILQALVELDVSVLVPEVGMNIVGATPYAESVQETAAVEGRLRQTLSGVAATGGVRFGASSHVARFLLAARESDPELRFALNCQLTDAIETGLGALGGIVSEYDRQTQSAETSTRENATMQWGARQAIDAVEETPVAVLDRGAHGKEPVVKLLADSPAQLVERARTLRDVV